MSRIFGVKGEILKRTDCALNDDPRTGPDLLTMAWADLHDTIK
jgi:hypothetical protein